VPPPASLMGKTPAMSKVRADFANRTDSEVRLPWTVVPSAYSLDVMVNLNDERFSGEAVIALSVREAVSEIVCNALELAISDAYLIIDGTSSPDLESQSIDLTIELLPDIERVRFVPADRQTLAAGEYTLVCAFGGQLNQEMAGFYVSTTTLANGETVKIATTQMQSTDARRAFPCWDEPAFKATFTIALTIPELLVALSNGSVVSDEAVGDGMRQVVFATTMVMSSYLVAYCVGPFVATDPVIIKGVPLRIVTLKGQEHLTSTALDIGAHALEYFVDWFGREYPADKLDLIAVPDFEAGAMENLGLVIFRETTLLVDANTASRFDIETVADVVSHEVAHMWFGDLVTMQWWEGIWLNEAFATFCEVLAVNDWKPEWKRWVTEASYKGSSMVVDGLSSTRPIEFPVRLPSDAAAMFDTITYQKGGAVLRMLEQYLGADRFRDGIRNYISTHAFGNTVTTDLWDAIEVTTGEPVRALMDTWIYQKGYPLVTAVREGDTIRVDQNRFTYLAEAWSDAERNTLWSIPIVVGQLFADGTRKTTRLLLDGSTASIPADPDAVAVVVNAGGTGYFRTVLSDQLLQQLLDNVSMLDEIERFNLVSDTWASVLAGMAPASQFVALMPMLGTERDPSVWSVLANGFDVVSRMSGIDLTLMRARLVETIQPLADDLGTSARPGEPQRNGTLRAAVWSTLGLLCQDKVTIEWAREAREAWLIDRASLDGDLVDAVSAIVAQYGNPSTFEKSLELVRHPVVPQDVPRELNAMAGHLDPVLVTRTLDYLWSDVTRAQDLPYVLRAMLVNRDNGIHVWNAIIGRWEALRAKLSPTSVARVVESIYLLPPQRVNEIVSFVESHHFPEGKLPMSRAIERLRVHARLIASDGSALFV